MRQTVTSVMVLFLAFCINSIKLDAQQRDWENERIFAVNTEKPRATFYHYPNEEFAKSVNYAQSPYFKLLNAKWKFNWSPNLIILNIMGADLGKTILIGITHLILEYIQAKLLISFILIFVHKKLETKLMFAG